MTQAEAIRMAASGWHRNCTDQEIAALQLYEERQVVPEFDIFHGAMEKAIGRPIQTLEFGLWSDRLKKEFESAVPDAEKLIERMRQAKESYISAADHEKIYQYEQQIREITGTTRSTEFMETEDFRCGQTGGQPAMLCVSFSQRKAWLELSHYNHIDLLERPKYEQRCAEFGFRECDSPEMAQQIMKELGCEPVYDENSAQQIGTVPQDIKMEM